MLSFLGSASLPPLLPSLPEQHRAWGVRITINPWLFLCHSFLLTLFPCSKMSPLHRRQFSQTCPCSSLDCFSLAAAAQHFSPFCSTFPEVPPTQMIDSAFASVFSILELTKTGSAQHGARSWLLKQSQVSSQKNSALQTLCYWNFAR